MSEKIISVSKNESNKNAFSSVTEALGSIPKENQAPVTIRIAPGVYREKITIDRPFVTLLGTGERNGDVVLSFDDYANFVMEDGTKRGTFRSYSVLVDAHDVTLRNLTIENASGDSLTHGQAIALYADGDRLTVDSCRITGHQDTLFTGPLPPKEVIKDGFIGPKQFAPRIQGRQYYKNCYICGDVDFIFGGAAAFFEDCLIESLRRFPEENFPAEKGDGGIQGYVTAASTPEEEAFGYVFLNCKFVSEACPPASVYLGRPWREYAKTIFIGGSYGEHIHPSLFHDWNKENARKTVFYGACRKDFGEAFDRRADFVREIGAEEAEHFSKEKVLAGKDGWNPV